MTKLFGLEKINVKKSYLIFGLVVFVASVIQTFASEFNITYLFITNISYHLIFWFWSFLPRLSKDFSPTQHGKIHKHFRFVAYFLLIASAFAPISIALNLFVSDLIGALGMLPAFAAGLSGIKILQQLQKEQGDSP